MWAKIKHRPDPRLIQEHTYVTIFRRTKNTRVVGPFWVMQYDVWKYSKVWASHSSCLFQLIICKLLSMLPDVFCQKIRFWCVCDNRLCREMCTAHNLAPTTSLEKWIMHLWISIRSAKSLGQMWAKILELEMLLHFCPWIHLGLLEKLLCKP